MEKKEDRRTTYSKMVIRESLFELLEKKPLNKISVREICEGADVNRCTFYAYYTDIFDLYNKVVSEYFDKQQAAIDLAQQTVFKNVKDLSQIALEDYKRIALQYITTVKENQKLCRIIYSQNTDNTVHTIFGKHFFDEMINEAAPSLSQDVIDKFKVTYNFISGGTTAMIIWWLQNDCRMSVEVMAKQLAYYYYDIYNGHKLKQLPKRK